jgi:hypothetical protein
MADQNEVDLDSVIDRLLEVRGSRPGKQVQLLEAEIRYLCTKAREIFISQPILLELEAPIKVCVPWRTAIFRNNILMLHSRSAVIFTGSTMISSDSSNTAAFLQKRIISFWEITSIEANSPWKRYACF